MSIPFFSRGSFPGESEYPFPLVWFFFALPFRFDRGDWIRRTKLDDNVITWPCDAVEYPVKHAQNTESTYQ